MAPNGTTTNVFNINTNDNDQLLSDIAFNNQNYLVTWEDRRNPSQIYYTRVTPAGIVINDTGIKISRSDSFNYYWEPAVASNGDNYLIAWLGTRLSGDAILASRVDSAGIILDSTPLALTDDTLLRNWIVLGSDGENYLACWSGETPDTVGMDLSVRRISANGTILDSQPKLIARSYWGIYEQSIVYGGGCYLAVWNSNDNIYACRILPNGTVLDSGGFVICDDSFQQLDPSVASDGHRFFVTWTDNRSGYYDIYGVFVDSLANVGLEEKSLTGTNINLTVRISPVPFTDKVNIKLNMRGQHNYNLNIYDISGKLVKSFANPRSPIPNPNIVWDGKDNNGYILPNGTYFCRLRTNSVSVTKRIIKLKK